MLYYKQVSPGVTQVISSVVGLRARICYNVTCYITRQVSPGVTQVISSVVGLRARILL